LHCLLIYLHWFVFISRVTMDTTLLIMAAWMWSRYWWLKQIDAFWPHGETILEYSIYDAIQAWFTKVVLVIRKSFHEDFKQVLGDKFSDKIEVIYVFQEINPMVEWFDLPKREKPWWTWHAVLSAEPAIHEPFCVINADDWYWRDAFVKMHTYLTIVLQEHTCSMVGYVLENTLSSHGMVNRWVCELNPDWTLYSINEHLKIGYRDDVLCDEKGDILSKDMIVSMNFRGFHPTIFWIFNKEFRSFLQKQKDIPTSEFFITTPPNTFVHEAGKACDVLISNDAWHGVTYAEDKPYVQKAITSLVSAWKYPEILWDS
jgi:hypothetical protein